MKAGASFSRWMRGLSLIELMVGLAVGLVLVSAALLAWGQHVRHTRQLLLETRVMQDLRSTAGLMARNLRRAGHWADAAAGVWQGGTQPATPNPHAQTEVGVQQVGFSHSPPGPSGEEPADAGALGYRLRQGIVEMQIQSGPWQAMTDRDSTFVTGLALSSEVLHEPLGQLCAQPCPADSGEICPPHLEVKRISLRMEASSPHDPSIQRRLQSTVRLRNDTLHGSCPP